MNVLFIGPYKQRDGWGNAAKAYVRSLIASGVNLTIRPIFMNHDKEFDKCEDFKSYEDKRYDKYDVVIQNVLPHMFRRYEDTTCIGLSYFESTHLQYTPWPNHINTMDYMWVTSVRERQSLMESGVTIPIDIIPIGCDPSIYKKEYTFDKMNAHKDEFIFYFIGEYITRKNIRSLITAFHREFHPDENARLLLKLNKIGMSDHDLFSHITSHIQQQKTDMNMYPGPRVYKPEIVICAHLPIEELYGLHQFCDCFVVPSFGEAFCMPAFDAMAFGKTPIVGDNLSVVDFVTVETGGYTVKSTEVPAIAADRALPFLYTGRDSWWRIDINDLQAKMREAFNKKGSSVDKDELATVVEAYSYEAVGSKIRRKLS